MAETLKQNIMIKFPLKSWMGYINNPNGNRTESSDISVLIDDSIGSNAYNPTQWKAGWIQPVNTIIVLDEFNTPIIKEFRFFYNTGNTTDVKFFLVRKDTKEKVQFFNLKGGGWIDKEQIIQIPVELQVEHESLVIESTGNVSYPNYIQLWGDFTIKQWPTSNKTRLPLTLLRGTNIKPWDICFGMFPEKYDILKSLKLGSSRLYNDWELIYNKTINQFEFNGFWKQIDNVKRMKDELNIDTIFCYHAYPQYPFKINKLNSDTYLDVARDVTNIAINIANNDQYVKRFEIGNEHDRDWEGPDNYMDGRANVLMCSVCYDGHKGKYPGIGIKTVNKDLLVLNPGMANSRLDPLWVMWDYAKQIRGLRPDGYVDLPFDIYSVHCYPFVGGIYSDTEGTLNPELGMLIPIENIIHWTEKYAPWLRVSCNEWGWDANSSSVCGAPVFSSYNSEQVRAFWVARTLILFAMIGLDYSDFYRIIQDYFPNELQDQNAGLFVTMALIRQTTEAVKQDNGLYANFNFKRTLAGDYFSQIAEIMTVDCKYVETIKRDDNGLWVVKFNKLGKDIYAVWMQEEMSYIKSDLSVDHLHTSFKERTGTYTFPTSINGKIKRFVDDLSGTLKTEDFNSNTITVNSRPLFIEVDSITTIPPTQIKEIFHRGYLSLGGEWGKRYYYILYTDHTYTQTNGRYVPIEGGGYPMPV